MREKIIIKYGELWLKSEPVRMRFIKQLSDNIRRMLRDNGIKNFSLEKTRDMLVLETLETGSRKAQDVLKKVFGISWFARARETEANMESIEKAALEAAKAIKPGESFAIRASRSDKSFGCTSKDIEEKIGSKIKGKVNLSNPDFTIFAEVKKTKAYIYSEKIRGLGGMPFGVSGRVLSLISGGIDSAVSSWMMMKRGCLVDFVYFHPEIFTGNMELEKVMGTVKMLREYSPCSLNLYVVPFSEIQKIIVENCERRMTCVLCRRSMYRAAQMLAGDTRSKALVTGENLAQVASQTLDNLYVENGVLKMPIFRPLIGMDKEETIRIAKKIGTYNISIGAGCCALSPKKPSTKARLDRVLAEEKKAKNLDKLIKSAVKNTDKVII